MRPFDNSIAPPEDSEVTRIIHLRGAQLRQQKGFRWKVNEFQQFTHEADPSAPFLVQYYSSSESQRTPDCELSILELLHAR